MGNLKERCTSRKKRYIFSKFALIQGVFHYILLEIPLFLFSNTKNNQKKKVLSLGIGGFSWNFSKLALFVRFLDKISWKDYLPSFCKGAFRKMPHPKFFSKCPPPAPWEQRDYDWENKIKRSRWAVGDKFSRLIFQTPFSHCDFITFRKKRSSLWKKWA